ncbi:hypothetical protein [Streptomyces sp. CNQ-509]|nr:hypothetical protein [Streptomyces sp. CNQ-509]
MGELGVGLVEDAQLRTGAAAAWEVVSRSADAGEDYPVAFPPPGGGKVAR